MRIIAVIFISTLSLYGGVWSKLSLSVPTPLSNLKIYITQRSGDIKNKLIEIQQGVMGEIEEQLELKSNNNDKLRRLSKVDYVYNKRMEFLLHKENLLSDLNIDNTNMGNLPRYLHLNKLDKKKNNVEQNIKLKEKE
jgi:hypothetical protein